MGKSSFLQDFKAFAMRGNVIDMAVGVIIGGAFGKIVSSIVADVIMPPIGLLVGGVNFTDLKLPLAIIILMILILIRIWNISNLNYTLLL